MMFPARYRETRLLSEGRIVVTIDMRESCLAGVPT